MALQFFITGFYLDKLPIYIVIFSNLSLIAYFLLSIYSLTKTTKLELTSLNLEQEKENNKILKDIQDEFGFTAANSYYHLNKMQNSGMLLTRNQGRKVLYRINQIYFNRLSNIFGEYGCLEIKHPS